MSFSFNLEPLKASIDKFGILNPRYLIKDSDSTFTVVAGYRGLLAVRELGWQDIVCQILPDNFPPLEALLLGLNDNLIHRQLNNIEKGMVFKGLTRFLKEGEIVRDFMPTLGISANPLDDKNSLCWRGSIGEMALYIKGTMSQHMPLSGEAIARGLASGVKARAGPENPWPRPISSTVYTKSHVWNSA